MKKNQQVNLLPKGFEDRLQPEGRRELACVARLLGVAEQWGYEQVVPPMVEFEHSLLLNANDVMKQNTFRVMDAESHSMMGIRADMTGQVARIAVTRLAEMPRPLRLSYAGSVLRAKGRGLYASRELTQMGMELIGAPSEAADAEIMLLSLRALEEVGLFGLTLDIGMSNLVSQIITEEGLKRTAAKELERALSSRELSSIRKAAPIWGKKLAALVEAAGEAEDALPEMQNIVEGTSLEAPLERIAAVVARLKSAAKNTTITLDIFERRGFAYHTGICFTVFAENGEEVARGGRYAIAVQSKKTTQKKTSKQADKTETAVGVTLLVNSILRTTDLLPEPDRVYLPFGTSIEEAEALISRDQVVVFGLEPERDVKAAAKAQRCHYALIGGKKVRI